MYSKEGTLIDRREMLRVKIKSLAAEARFIRREELRTTGQLREELYRHRMDVVRLEARASLAAYAIIRGRDLAMGQYAPGPAEKAKVDAMVRKYGPREQATLRKAA